jgi:hypothetical protein
MNQESGYDLYLFVQRVLRLVTFRKGLATSVEMATEGAQETFWLRQRSVGTLQGGR